MKGKKTYIVAGVAGVLTAAHMLGYIDTEAYTAYMGLLGAGGLATLRMGVASIKEKK